MTNQKEIEIRKINELTSEVYNLIIQLRDELTFEEFIDIYNEAKKSNNYTLIGYYKNDQLISLLGYRILFDFLHGKHMYIDDLITHKEFRSKGIGSQILQIAESKAKEMNCSIIRLSTGVDHQRGIEFYKRENWTLKAVTFKKLP